MDLFGVQLLVGVVLTILIVFPGTVPPAYKQFLDTVIGRLLGVSAVIALTHMGGWPIGALAATAVLILTPNTLREGFIGQEGFNGANKIQKVPKERRQKWFIESVMHENTKALETDTANTQAVQ